MSDGRILDAGTMLLAMLEEQGFTADEGLVVFDVALRLGRFAAGSARAARAEREASEVFKRTGFG